MPARLYVCVPVCLSVCLSVCLPACLPARLPARLPTYMPACLPACLSVCLSVCLPVCLPGSLSVCLAICLCVPTYLPACLYVTVSLSLPHPFQQHIYVFSPLPAILCPFINLSAFLSTHPIMSCLSSPAFYSHCTCLAFQTNCPLSVHTSCSQEESFNKCRHRSGSHTPSLKKQDHRRFEMR